VTGTADLGVHLAAQIGDATTVLTDDEVTGFVGTALDALDLEGSSVCVIVPDATRSCPLPLVMKAIHAALHGRVSRLTVLVALGTHSAMSEPALARWLCGPDGDLDGLAGATVRNHEWWDPHEFVSLGEISADRIGALSGGRLHQGVEVRLNRAVADHDVALVVGPVFPHEVVGFSGGNKYFFPGVGGQEVIDLSHWLGALITSAEIIGAAGITPVRALIDEAAAMVPSRRLAFCLVTQPGTDRLHTMTFGTPETAWAQAAEVSATTHVRSLDAPVHRAIAVIPRRYDDMWTAAKGFYKLEPVMAGGGEVILYAPHIRQLSATHPEIERIGYHCRDYFVHQWERFRDEHWGVLAHSTHLRGQGTWDPVNGERCRLTVTLATGIPADVVRAANLSYLDPASLDVGAEPPDTLVVPNAGETLFRLR
jgi:nickel-dependent lactate racemase